MSRPGDGPRPRAWRVCYAIGCVLLVAPLWIVEYPPMVDLSQHAAQVAVAVHWPGAGGLAYPDIYEVNWLASQWVAFGASYLFALFLPVVPAVKLVLSLSLLAIPLTTWLLVREVDGDPWTVFAAFPVAYGYAFYWGFLSFVAAVPLGLLLIRAAVRFAARPGPRGAWALFGLACLCFLGHVLVLGYAGLCAALVIQLRAPTRRDRLVGAGALAAVLPIVAAWWVAQRLLAPSTTPTPVPRVLDLGPGRVPELASHLVGEPAALLPVAFGAALLAVPFLMGGRPSRSAWRWVPFLVAVLLCLFFPLNALDTAFLYPRFAVFIVPGLLLAFDAGERPRDLSRGLAVALAAVWLGVVAWRFAAFDGESRPARELVDRIDPGSRVLTLVDWPGSRAVPWWPYLHFGSWYQAETGGVADFSFAEFYPNHFRYRPEADPPLPYNVEWGPRLFRWTEHGGERWDYFLVRRAAGPDWNPFAGADRPVELVERRGTWWLFRQERPRS